MSPVAPKALQAKAARWEALTRWERAELGRDLRRLGWSYGEIRSLIPVPKGTLSHWCRDIDLTDEQVAAIRDRTGSVRGVPRNTQWRRREEIERIRANALRQAVTLASDPFWVAGTVLYWAEGAKTSRRLELANSDPRTLRLFMAWVKRFHQDEPRFVVALHLHEENDEPAAQRAWQDLLGMKDAEFHRSFIKPRGTGHRKNHLPHGICRIRLRRSTDAWIRTMAWIDALSHCLDLAD